MVVVFFSGFSMVTLSVHIMLVFIFVVFVIFVNVLECYLLLLRITDAVSHSCFYYCY